MQENSVFIIYRWHLCKEDLSMITAIGCQVYRKCNNGPTVACPGVTNHPTSAILSITSKASLCCAPQYVRHLQRATARVIHHCSHSFPMTVPSQPCDKMSTEITALSINVYHAHFTKQNLEICFRKVYSQFMTSLL